MRLINILSFISFGLVNIQLASLIFTLKNFISTYRVTRAQFVFIALLINGGLLLHFDRGVDWYRIHESFERGSLEITKPFRFMAGEVIGSSVSSFIVYWLLVRGIFYFNIYWLTRTLLESLPLGKIVVKNRVSISALMFVSFALFPISTVVSFESASAMTFVLCVWLKVLNNVEVRWMKYGCLAFVIHPGAILGLLLIKPVLCIVVALALIMVPYVGISELQIFIEYAQLKFINYIYGPWSFYAGVGEFISPARAIILLLLLSVLKISENDYKIKISVIKILLPIALIVICTVPFRTLYFRVGDPLLILILLKMAASMSSLRVFYSICITVMLSTQNIYWFIGLMNNIDMHFSSISYIERVLNNIELGPSENIYRGNLISGY